MKDSEPSSANFPPQVPVVVLHGDPGSNRSPRPPGSAPPRQNRLLESWRRAGGGSLTLSVLLHAALLLAAYFVVETVVLEKKVDFLPGGGSSAAQQADASLNELMQVKRQQRFKQPQPLQRLVSQTETAAIRLPDAPVVMPEFNSLIGMDSMSSGGFGGSGFGGGAGAGMGMGSAKGFLTRTYFGNLGASGGLAGTLYDFKQDKKGNPIAYDPNGYFQKAREFAAGGFAPSRMKDFFQAPQQMNFTFLAVPLMTAEEGPKAFAVEKHVQPRGWLVHYGGMITPPEPGEWRFVGYFDDALAVYINKKPVLDASRDVLVNLQEGTPDAEVRQSFGGMNVLNGKCYAGKWVTLAGPVRIDIIVGERPGGQVGGLLLVENKRAKYKKRDNGTPVLPLFTTSQPDKEDLRRMRDFSEANAAFGLELKDIPVFKTNASPSLEGGRMPAPGIGLLPPR